MNVCLFHEYMSKRKKMKRQVWVIILLYYSTYHSHLLYVTCTANKETFEDIS